LAADVDLELFDQRRRDGAEDIGAMLVAFAQEALVVFHGARADILAVARQVQGKLHAGIKAVSLCRFPGGPLFEFHDDEQADHGVDFLGGAAKGSAEVFRYFRSGQTFEGRAPEDPLPTFIEGAPRGRIKLGVDPVGLEVVEEQVLWQLPGGVQMAHWMG